MKTTRKSIRMEKDIDPQKYGFETFTDLANAAIAAFIAQNVTRQQEAADMVTELTKTIQNWQFDPDKLNDEETEFLETLNQVYQLLIRTDLVAKNPALFRHNGQKWIHREAYSEVGIEYLTQLANKKL